jgi:hypothetical protein
MDIIWILCAKRMDSVGALYRSISIVMYQLLTQVKIGDTTCLYMEIIDPRHIDFVDFED